MRERVLATLRQDIDTRFHDRILAMAGNSLLISVMEPADGRLRRAHPAERGVAPTTR